MGAQRLSVFMGPKSSETSITMFSSSFNNTHQNFVPSKDVYITNLFKRITDETDRKDKANLEHQLMKALTVCMYIYKIMYYLFTYIFCYH